jgi:hypothetical protein
MFSFYDGQWIGVESMLVGLKSCMETSYEERVTSLYHARTRIVNYFGQL